MERARASGAEDEEVPITATNKVIVESVEEKVVIEEINKSEEINEEGKSTPKSSEDVKWPKEINGVNKLSVRIFKHKFPKIKEELKENVDSGEIKEVTVKSNEDTLVTDKTKKDEKLAQRTIEDQSATCKSNKFQQAKEKYKTYSSINSCSRAKCLFLNPDHISCFHKGPVTQNDTILTIMKVRKDFEHMMYDKKAPFTLPTLFQNHEEHDNYVIALNNRRQQENDFLPPTPFFDPSNLYGIVYGNISNMFEESMFLKHANTAELFCLKTEFDQNVAFEEILMQRPFFYFQDIEVKKKSKYLDLKVGKNGTLPPMSDRCFKPGKFVVDFSIIYPEGKVSSVFIYCSECGKLAETVFRTDVLLNLQNEIMKLLMFFKIDSDKPGSFRATMPLSTQFYLALNGPTFTSGSVGITPLVRGTVCSPSVFVRTQITYIVSPICKVPTVMHNFPDQGGFYPQYVQHLLK